MSEITVTKDNFQTEVLESDIPVLVDFWATWCGPCRMLAPVIEKIAEENAGILKVGKVNVDEEAELAMTFRISAIPTLILFKDGEPAGNFMGFADKGTIEAFLSQYIQGDQ